MELISVPAVLVHAPDGVDPRRPKMALVTRLRTVGPAVNGGWKAGLLMLTSDSDQRINTSRV